MNLPYTMPPGEAADCIKAFKPKIVIRTIIAGRTRTCSRTR